MSLLNLVNIYNVAHRKSPLSSVVSLQKFTGSNSVATQSCGLSCTHDKMNIQLNQALQATHLRQDISL